LTFKASECPDVKNYKWRLNPVWHRMLHSYTHMATLPSSSWREAFRRSLPPLRSFARTVGPPLAAGPQSLLHPCRGRSGESRWSMVGHRRVSTPVKVAHHPSSWCRFVGSGLLVHRVEVWRRDQRHPLANDVRDVEQAGTMQDFIVGYEVVPSDVQDASLAVGTVHGKNPVYSSRLVWGYRSQSHRVVWVTRTWSICGASWWHWACSDSRHNRVFSMHWPRVQCAGYIPVWSCSYSTVYCPGMWTLQLGRQCFIHVIGDGVGSEPRFWIFVLVQETRRPNLEASPSIETRAARKLSSLSTSRATSSA